MASPDWQRLVGAEGVARLRHAALVPHDWMRVVPLARPGDDVVVLVHGFLASAGVFRPLRARIARETGARVASFTHPPGVSVRRIAAHLAQLVERIPTDTCVTIVGHSLGGVVARWYVQEMGGSDRVARTVSMGSPFGGVDVPHLLVGADLCEESALLAQIREGAAACRVPHTSIVAGSDTLVPGVGTACLGVGDVVVLDGRGHNVLLFDEEAAAIVVDRIRRAHSERSAAAEAL